MFSAKHSKPIKILQANAQFGPKSSMYIIIEKNVKKPYIMICKRYALKASTLSERARFREMCISKGNHKQCWLKCAHFRTPHETLSIP